MLQWFKQLDGILRGDATRLPALQEGKISFPIGGLTIVTILLGVIYGLCMGSFAMIRTSGLYAVDCQWDQAANALLSHPGSYVSLALRL